MVLPIHADNDDPLKAAMLDAHNLLMKALDEGDADARIDELKLAREIIHHTQPLPLGPSRSRAVSLIGSALAELKQGDPKDVVRMYIRQADRKIGY